MTEAERTSSHGDLLQQSEPPSGGLGVIPDQDDVSDQSESSIVKIILFVLFIIVSFPFVAGWHLLKLALEYYILPFAIAIAVLYLLFEWELVTGSDLLRWWWHLSLWFET